MGDPIILSHTEIVHHPDGSVSTQRFGPGHVVEGSVRVIDVPPGVTVVVRHLRSDAMQVRATSRDDAQDRIGLLRASWVCAILALTLGAWLGTRFVVGPAIDRAYGSGSAHCVGLVMLMERAHPGCEAWFSE